MVFRFSFVANDDPSPGGGRVVVDGEVDDDVDDNVDDDVDDDFDDVDDNADDERVAGGTSHLWGGCGRLCRREDAIVVVVKHVADFADINIAGARAAMVHRLTVMGRYTRCAWAGGTFFPVVLSCLFLVLAENRGLHTYVWYLLGKIYYSIQSGYIVGTYN
jgi:hypothetical protein